jgi:adrenodoxin-NADP+ reductase
VGSGPSSFYALKYLLSSPNPPSSVSILDTNTTPFGLIRSGVAPDHQDVKNAVNDYTTIFNKHKHIVKYYGNVHVSDAHREGSVTVSELSDLFDTVILGTGCQSDRKLTLPTIDLATGVTTTTATLPTVLPSRALVNYYNGHSLVPPPLPSRLSDVVVIGAGNVSLDITRVLLKASTASGLDSTDVPTPVINDLHDRTSDGVNVNIVARRGITQMKLGIKELREVYKSSLLPDSTFNLTVDPEEMELSKNEASLTEIETTRPLVRLTKLYDDINNTEYVGGRPSEVSVRVLLNPVAYVAENGVLKGVQFRRQELTGEAGRQGCVDAVCEGGEGEEDTFEDIVIPADVCVLSLGYVNEPMVGLEDAFENGQYRHVNGWIRGNIYVVGWAKRGASGIVGTNIPDAKQTVTSVLENVGGGGVYEEKTKSGAGLDMEGILKDRNVDYTTWEGWERIDAVERAEERKRCAEQPREKVVGFEKLLRIARQ